MYQKLNVVLNDTCPKKVRKVKLKTNVWYTGKHKELAKKIKTAYKKGKRNLGEAWTYYKKLIKRYKNYARGAGMHFGKSIRRIDKQLMK